MRADMKFPYSRDVSMFESLLNTLPLFIVAVDREGKVVWLSRKASDITGFETTQARGERWFDEELITQMLEYADDVGVEAVKKNVSNQVLPLARGGEELVSGWFLPVMDAAADAVVLVFVSSSICELHASVRDICITGHDELTGLAGRNMAYEQLKHSMAKAKRRQGKVGVIFLDVDDFKRINDMHGHAAGDRVLRTVAERLLGAVRESDIVARIGGDEFLIILNEIDGVMDCEVVAEKIIDVFSRAIDVGGGFVLATTSMGVSIYPGDGSTCDEVVSNADTAMYYAKKSGKNKFHYFTGEDNRAIQRRLSLESMLRDAVRENSFVVMYQPIVEAESGRVRQLEALVRWERGNDMVLPSEFLADAEESGIIVPIGEDVMHKACRDAVGWSALSGEDISVTVNVSLRQWMSGGIPGLVNEVLQESGIEPSCLQLELTESSLFHKYDFICEQLKKLRDLGVMLSLDNFGVGYSSLSCIEEVPLTTVKIDGIKVHELTNKGAGLAFCEAVTAMTHSYSKKVVAEKVESSRQLRKLQDIGVDYVQGSYISNPLRREAVDYIFS